MLIVGERINSSRKSILKAIDERDGDFIVQEAINQVEAGATYIDVNAAARLEHEIEDLQWLVQTVQGGLDVPLCIDSPSAAAIHAGLLVHRGQAMVNSISGEKDRLEAILPLVKEHNALVVGLTIDERGMPQTSAQRLEVAEAIAAAAEAQGISRDRVYIDFLVRCVSAEADQGLISLEAIEQIRTALPGIHAICGLSNISYGLPQRGLLNRTFLAMAIGRGLDAAILDPTDRRLMAVLRAARAITNEDEYCMEYITAHRAGILQE
jgi:5-methyltetrahydrofolate--homocysteine methyltransferase